MTTQDTPREVNNQDDLGAKEKYLLDAYRIQLDIFKLQNDNYFKRIQILMILIQAGLLKFALRFITIESGSIDDIVLLVGVTSLGILSAYLWSSLIDKQKQYSEFCRLTLRNIESKLTEFGIPLRYFTLESHIFARLDKSLISLAGTSIQNVVNDNRHIARFEWSDESFPNTKGKGIYSSKKVRGGLVGFEKKIAIGLIIIWGIVFILLVIRWIFSDC